MNRKEPHYADLPIEHLPPIRRNPIHVVLDNLRSAYNVGSIFRTADAGAVEHVDLCGMSAHPPHKKLEKTALGAFDYIPWTYWERTTDCLDDLKAKGITPVAIEVTETAQSHFEYDWPNPVAIVFGNEVTGVSERIQRRCAATVCIPMHGYKNTINVATAFGVILFEIVRRFSRLD